MEVHIVLGHAKEVLGVDGYLFAERLDDRPELFHVGHVCAAAKEILEESSLEDGPDGLDRIKGAAVGRHEAALEVLFDDRAAL